MEKRFKAIMAEKTTEIASLWINKDVDFDIIEFNHWLRVVSKGTTKARMKDDILCIEPTSEEVTPCRVIRGELDDGYRLHVYEISYHMKIVEI